MAVLPSLILSNPNASAAVVGTTAGAVAYGIFEQDPVSSIAIGAGTALLTRGLIHLDTETHTFQLGKSKIIVAEIGDDKYSFAGTINMADLGDFDPDKLLSQLSGSAPAPKAKAKAKAA